MGVRINKDKLDALPPELRKQFESDLAELDAIFEQNPLQRFEPYPKQETFLASRDRIKAFFAGNRAGKSTIGVVDDLIQAVDEDCLPAHLRQFKKFKPPFYCRVVTPDLSHTLEVITNKLREWAPTYQLRGDSFDNAYDKGLRVLNFKNGSWIQFLSNDQEVNKHGGAALHRCHYDEEPSEAIRNEDRMRLADYGGDELFTMTPLEGLTWTYDAIFERRHEDGITVVQASIEDNPHLDEQSVAEILSGLTEEERQARAEGRFVHFAGLVYKEFDDALHICDSPTQEHLQGQSILVGIDPGITRGGVLWTAFDQDNDGLVFDEFYPSGLTIDQVVAEIRRKNAAWGIEPDYYVIDPSARNRPLTGGESVESAFHRCGIYPTYGKNDLQAGVFEIKRRLQRKLNGQPAPAFVVARNCRKFLWEMGRYRIKETDDGSFAVVRRDNHLADCARYLCAERAWGPDPVVETPRPTLPHNDPLLPRQPRQEDSHPLGAMV